MLNAVEPIIRAVMRRLNGPFLHINLSPFSMGVLESTYSLVSGTWVETGDLDGDGDLDVFIAAGGSEPDQIWLNRNAAAPPKEPLFTKSDISFGANDPRWAVAVADFDGDSDPDIFAPGYRNSGALWTMNEADNFEDTGQTLDWPDASWVSHGDLDGDGDIDVFASSRWVRCCVAE